MALQMYVSHLWLQELHYRELMLSNINILNP